LPLFLLILLSSCAKPEDINACVNEVNKAGFFLGLFHGFIAPVTFVLSLFLDDVAVYAVNNTGGWYDFGFLLGIGAFGGGSAKATKKRK
jgi:hypothetical protein